MPGAGGSATGWAPGRGSAASNDSLLSAAAGAGIGRFSGRKVPCAYCVAALLPKVTWAWKRPAAPLLTAHRGRFGGRAARGDSLRARRDDRHRAPAQGHPGRHRAADLAPGAGPDRRRPWPSDGPRRLHDPLSSLGGAWRGTSACVRRGGADTGVPAPPATRRAPGRATQNCRNPTQTRRDYGPPGHSKLSERPAGCSSRRSAPAPSSSSGGRAAAGGRGRPALSSVSSAIVWWSWAWSRRTSRRPPRLRPGRRPAGGLTRPS
jgi:hypothetical protein